MQWRCCEAGFCPSHSHIYFFFQLRSESETGDSCGVPVWSWDLLSGFVLQAGSEAAGAEWFSPEPVCVAIVLTERARNNRETLPRVSFSLKT